MTDLDKTQPSFALQPFSVKESKRIVPKSVANAEVKRSERDKKSTGIKHPSFYTKKLSSSAYDRDASGHSF
jgi:hypothetical protein